ncbi:hypothetical protein G6L05_22120 [Agrobacterium rhizogenes]|nr:hypothetical protein [Rhizobium rhizogenes]
MAIVTAAIGIMQAIAAANRGDGGLGAQLSALNAKVDIAIEQLASLQKSVSFLIAQIAALREDLFVALGEQYVYELHTEVAASIQKIKDIHDEATIAKIDLSAESAKSTQLYRDFVEHYRIFDVSRNKLRAVKGGVSSGPTALCSACVAVDSLAFGYGVISDIGFSIILKHHIDWLDRMLDDDVELSVESMRKKEIGLELAVVRRLKAAAKDGDVPADIASGLWDKKTFRMCVKLRASVKYWNLQFYTVEKDAGVAEMVYVIDFARETRLEAGAPFLVDPVCASRSAAFRTPIPWVGYAYGAAESFDHSATPVVERYFFVSKADSRRLDIFDGYQPPPVLWKKLHPYVSGLLIDAPEYRRLVDEETYHTLADVTKHFDEINSHRIRRQLAKVCIGAVTEHREIVLNLQKMFPKT